MAGESDKISGSIKEKVGSATGNDRLEGEGKGQKHAGKVEGAIDSAKEKAKGAADAAKDLLGGDKKH
ncbi:MAG: CsbD family protein [Pseudomonas sp.]|nr:CsbD family protein [Pseudomonas sp.]